MSRVLEAITTFIVQDFGIVKKKEVIHMNDCIDTLQVIMTVLEDN
jgi:hypothetical protein